MTVFLSSLLAGGLLVLLFVMLWQLALRIGLLLPRKRSAQRKLLCVRPLDFDA